MADVTKKLQIPSRLVGTNAESIWRTILAFAVQQGVSDPSTQSVFVPSDSSIVFEQIERLASFGGAHFTQVAGGTQVTLQAHLPVEPPRSGLPPSHPRGITTMDESGSTTYPNPHA